MPNPVALITGGSRGIGRACAAALAAAAEPCDVAVQYRENAAAATALVQQITDAKRARARAFQADLAQPGAAAALVDAVASSFGAPTVLVHAAGHFVEKPITFTKFEELNALLEVHAIAAASLAKALLPFCRKTDRGRIVLIGSVAGVVGMGNAAAYAAAKGALEGLCKSLALEAARWQTTVNVVAPGFVETDMTATHDAARRAQAAQAIPLGRYAKPEEIAGLVAFLCSAQCSYLTGQTILVDGGMSLG